MGRAHMSVQQLLEQAKVKGLTVFLGDGQLKVRPAQEPEGEARALVEELRQRKQEVLKALTPEVTPEAITPPSCWNCGQRMAPITDINGKATHYCPACEVSSEDLEALPDLPKAWRVEEIRAGTGVLQAVKICSAVLKDHLWVILDRTFTPTDDLAQYYVEELPELDKKSLEDLRAIHKAKLAFPGCRVVQEGPDKESPQ